MEEKLDKIVTRFAPSPTGLLHLGNYRTAVFAYLFAKKNNGKFILRIEDTDRLRSKKEYEDNILESLKWLGLSYDNFYRQSENLKDHTEALEKLIASGKAYISKEEAKDGSGIIKEIVRFKNPNKVVVFEDLIRGKIETDTTDLGDFVIAKSITEPLFHLAVIVDDYNEGVTHVIRGEDHIPNTPRQILIHEALGIKHPTYAHLPLVLSQDRTKLSKRKGALPVSDYRDKGYLKEALLNFMAFIGWNPGGEREIYSLDELVNEFNLSSVHKGGAIFNEEKLNWMNKEHVKRQSSTEQFNELKKRLNGFTDELISKLQETIIERISNYGEVDTVINKEFEFFIKEPEVTAEKLIWKDASIAETIDNLMSVKNIIENNNYNNLDEIKKLIMPLAEEKGKGNVLWPLRYALSGLDKSVDPFTICSVLDKATSLRRLNKSIDVLTKIESNKIDS